jgi:hypothetical protein
MVSVTTDTTISCSLTCGLYYKHVTIVNDASSGVNKLKDSLNDAARGVIYERHMFIVQATGGTGQYSVYLSIWYLEVLGTSAEHPLTDAFFHSFTKVGQSFRKCNTFFKMLGTK